MTLSDLPTLRIEDVRRVVGGRRKYAGLKFFQISTEHGVSRIHFLSRHSNLGISDYQIMACPQCGRGCKILRYYSDNFFCTRCLQNLGFKYRSQQIFRLSSGKKGSEHYVQEKN